MQRPSPLLSLARAAAVVFAAGATAFLVHSAQTGATAAAGGGAGVHVPRTPSPPGISAPAPAPAPGPDGGEVAELPPAFLPTSKSVVLDPGPLLVPGGPEDPPEGEPVFLYSSKFLAPDAVVPLVGPVLPDGGEEAPSPPAPRR